MSDKNETLRDEQFTPGAMEAARLNWEAHQAFAVANAVVRGWGTVPMLPTRRCRLVVTENAATFDGKPLKVTPKQAEGLALLVEKDSEYVALTNVIRPERLQKGLPDELVALIDACSAGTRLLKEAWQT